MLDEKRAARSERPLVGLLSDLARDVALLVRQEIALARAELIEAYRPLAGDLGLVAGGALIAFAGFLVLLAAAVLALDQVIEPWLAALIVGGATLVIGIALAVVGRNRLRATSLLPQRAIRSVLGDAKWAKERTP
jgi:Putative Actinobacterial Holin-X, holin superfamily III